MTKVPSYARRRLGADLRRARTAAELSGEDAAETCGWDQSKISRIETGKVALSRHDLHRLCGLYGIAEDDTLRMEALLSDTRGPRWWAEYSDVINSVYEEMISLEAYASEMTVANSNLVMGLLQTREYATAVMNCGAMVPDPDRADALVEVRMRRQRVLTDEHAASITALVAESALQCEIGGRRVLSGQMRHLLEMSKLPNVTIHVLPAASPANVGIYGGHTLYDFAERHDPSVLFIEYQGGMMVKDSDRDIRRYRRHLNYLLTNALSVTETEQLITGRLRSL